MAKARPSAAATRPLYPSDHAFVIALHRDVDLRSGDLAGRVEHLSTGRVARFANLDVLLEFIRSAAGAAPNRSGE